MGQLAVQAEVSMLTAPQLVTSQPGPLSRLPPWTITLLILDLKMKNNISQKVKQLGYV
jgi:hypothetical protein